MKAISLWQPWATLIAMGEKRFETRSWSTKHRGLLAIHAAKKWDSSLKEYCEAEPFYSSLKVNGKDTALPLGAIVAVVKLIDVHRVEKVRDQLSNKELAFGNYADGRYAWELELVKQLETPVFIKGAQSVFEVPYDAVQKMPSLLIMDDPLAQGESSVDVLRHQIDWFSQRVGKEIKNDILKAVRDE